MVELTTFEEYNNPEIPKRVMKYVLIWCAEGNLNVVVDDKQLKLMPNQVLTITSGQIHYFKNISQASGFILEFTLDFFCKDDNDVELIFHNGLFCHFDLNEVIAVENHDAIENNLQMIRKELELKPYQYLISVRSRIALMLVEINRTKVDRGDEIYKPDALFLKFLELVRSNFSNNYSLAQYAAMLGTTEAKLNDQARLHAGKTAQNVIFGLITAEAKRLLIYENLPVKEVAYKLGFHDPFYFSNFFKKHSHLSPKSYQAQHTL